MKNKSSRNPTASIDLDFDSYLLSQQERLAAHLIGGIPDYAFSLDQRLRQQIIKMAPVRAIAQALVSLAVPIYKQIQQMNAVAVSPKQYPQIYTIGEECAGKLGIGIPQIFVEYSPVINGFTIATDDVAPMIVLSSALVDAMEFEELTFVIGHECGHIHNLHGVYNTAVELMTNTLAIAVLQSVPALSTLKWLIQGGLMLFMMRWSRCAEVTCDRAGVICCEDINIAQMALAKLATGGVDRLQKINLQEYIKQISHVQSTPVRFLELFQTHPLIPKRIEAIRLFADCDILSDWCPSLNFSGSCRKSEIDELCEKFINVSAHGYQMSSSPSSFPKQIPIE